MRPARCAKNCSADRPDCRRAILPRVAGDEYLSRVVKYFTAVALPDVRSNDIGRRCPNTRACRLGLWPRSTRTFLCGPATQVAVGPTFSPSADLFMPGPVVALDQRDGRGRPPGAGGIRPRLIRAAAPGFQDRFHPAPCRLDFVAPHEQRRVATYRVHHQPLVRIREPHAEGLLETDVECGGRQAKPARPR